MFEEEIREMLPQHELAVAMVFGDRRLNELYPDMFIGGGFPRDVKLSRDPHDIDVFTWHDIPFEEQLPREGDYPENDRIQCVSRPFIISDIPWPVQIIQLNSEVCPSQQVEFAVSQFGLGICQAWIERKVLEPRALQPFWHDSAMKHLTVTRCNFWWEAKHLLKKVDALRYRPNGYADHKMVIPPEFIDMFTDLAVNHTVEPSDAG